MANTVGAATVCGDFKSFLNNNQNLPKGSISLVTQSTYSPGAKITLGAVNANVGAQMLSIISTPQRGSHTGSVLVGSPFPHTPTMVMQGRTQTLNSWTPGTKKRTHDLMDSYLSDRERLPTGDSSASKRMRKVDKNGKGLRHFSMKVCEKVQRKGTTSYNEVADELVAEFTSVNGVMATDTQVYDQKNIRRRVYDALNVLMAMNIISKEKKEIRWIGLPTNSVRECESLEVEKQKRLERISQKKAQLEELVLQQIAFKNLVQRNKALPPPPPGTVIQLPFIVLNTDVQTVIDCSISSDKCEYLFNFDNTFELHDDVEILKRMGMSLGLESGRCTAQGLRTARSLLPKALHSYVLGLVKGAGQSALGHHTSSASADLNGGRNCDSGQPPSSFNEEEEEEEDEEENDDDEPSSPE